MNDRMNETIEILLFIIIRYNVLKLIVRVIFGVISNINNENRFLDLIFLNMSNCYILNVCRKISF